MAASNKYKLKYFNIFEHPLMGISIHNWVKVLSKNKWRVHVFFLPKLLFITATSLLNTPIQFVEFLRFNKRIKRQEVKSPVFILGHPRSGTTHLHYLLSKDDQFGFCTVYQGILPHMFLTGGKLFKGLIGSAMPETRPQDSVKMNIDSPKEEEFALSNMSFTSYLFGFYFPQFSMNHFKSSVTFELGDKNKEHWKNKFKYFMKKLSYTNEGKKLLLKSPANTGRIKEILELFPDARFIHIHRDPFEVYQSTVRLYEKIIPMTSFQSVDPNDVNEYIIQSYRMMYEKYFKDASELSDKQLIEVSYQDLISSPEKCLKNIYHQIGLEGFDAALTRMSDELNESKSYQRNSYSEQDPDLVERLKKEWGEVIQKLGYS